MNNAENTETKNTDSKSPVALREEAILNFWNQNNIFKKSLEKDSPLGEYVFYDGPPFATGTPHYGHILAGTMKDAIPRYRTMKGYRVDRRWGWDCHGLPVENLVEKEYNLSSKLDIEKMGIANFNKAARNSVFKYADVWREMVPRFGRWVDMDRDYKTMDPSYIETVWWVFNNLYNKKLIYEGFKSMHLCPHCETTLSNFEVASGYKDITDISVYVKFELEKEVGTYLIAWTTTPWTLPGNSALAINSKIDYLKIEIKGENGGKDERYIFAKDRLPVLENILKNAKKTFSILEEIKGQTLVGLSYKAIFPYYFEDKSLKNRNNGWKVYDADFVTTTDGTGIVHIAPAFGSDDYDLSLKNNIPFIQHVGRNGAFNKEVIDFASKQVKPKDTIENKDAHQSGDIEIIKYLAGKGSLLAKEKLVHSYPHCWRCETPLLNYASSSWFVKISEVKDKMLSENKKIKWIPDAIGSGRFDNSIASAPDWAISRSRYWGAPLPVWRSEDGEIFVPKSIADLKTRIKRRNKYIVMRHGQAENNTKNILNGKEPFAPFHLTVKGKEQVQKSAEEIADKFCGHDKIDLIIHSPFVRTIETAEIVASKLGIKSDFIISDSRLSELNTGIFDNGPVEKYHQFTKGNKQEENFYKAPPLGESWNDVSMRMGQFIREIDSKYQDKNILIVTHDSPAWLLFVASENLDFERALRIKGDGELFLENAAYKEMDFVPVPANENFCLDLHKPYIDEIKVYSKDGKEMKRVPEVFDCWFESGSMPYAEKNYLGVAQDNFDPKGGLFSKSKGFPADFIAEGQDQTRGWFYSMLVLGTALFGKSPYKNVIVNGLVLAEDGHKMSKSKNNYPDPKYLINKYGMDAIRYYLLSSPVVSAEDLLFSEKGVDEVLKKVINRFDNVISFFEMYAKDNDIDGKRLSPLQSKNVLDKWVIAKLKELSSIVSKNMELYELNSASRPIAGFIDDLSTWYLRRSRDRFKSSGNREDEEDKNYAIETTRYIIKEMSKIMAPFMPFFAEYAYGKVKEISDPESVHLCSWPESEALSSEEKEIIKNMDRTRKIVSIGLELRSSTNIKVRQPLASLTVPLEGAYSDLIKDEVNVKEIIDSPIKLEETSLDKNITAELKEEGELREFLRLVQDLRKKNNLKPKDKIKLFFTDTNTDLKNIIEKNREEVKRVAGVYEIDYSSQEISLLVI